MKDSKKLNISQKFRASFFALRTLYLILNQTKDIPKPPLVYAFTSTDLLHHAHSFILGNLKFYNYDSKNLEKLLNTIENLPSTPLSQQEINNDEFFDFCKNSFFKFLELKNHMTDNNPFVSNIIVNNKFKTKERKEWDKVFTIGFAMVT